MDKRIEIRLLESEHSKLKAIAKNKLLTVSALVRSLINKEIVKNGKVNNETTK
jgi:predicted DNA-binding ribbon-helix-helix protein